MRRIAFFPWVVVAVLAVLSILLLHDKLTAPSGQLPPPPRIADMARAALLSLSLPDTTGRIRSIAEWRNSNVLIINYWASWCKPCRTEMPVLSALYGRYQTQGLQVLGIATESAEQVDAYVRTVPAAYPVLVGGVEAIKLTREFGNEPQAVPFTIVLDRSGIVHAAVLGAVDGDALERLITNLLR